MDNDCEKKKRKRKEKREKRVLFVRTVCCLKREVTEEYSMLWVKSTSPDVPELVYMFCHYCSSFAGLNRVPFFARQSSSAMC